MTRILPLAALAVFAFSAPAMAVTQVTPGVDGDLVTVNPPSGPGVYGVETRIGNPGNWKIGVGTQTSNPGTFSEANFNWGPDGTFHDFSLSWTAGGIRFTVGSTTVSFAAPLLGNALVIDVKGDADLQLLDLEGTGFGTLAGTGVASSSNKYVFYAPTWGSDGITAAGKIRIGDDVGLGSRSGVNFRVGTFAPFGAVVPEPATWAMLIAGFGLVGVSLRRRQRVAA